MGQTFQASAVISLSDHLSGPLKTLANSVSNTASAMTTTFSKIGGVASTAMRVAESGIRVFGEAAHAAVDYQRTVNDIAATIQARNQQSTVSLQKLIDSADQTFKSSGGMSNSTDWMAAAKEAYTAGLDTSEAVIAMSNAAQKLGQASGLSTGETAGYLITLGNAFSLSTRTADGHAKSVDDLTRVYTRLGEAMLKVQKNSTYSSHGGLAAVADSFKLSAPLAERAGVPIEMLAAFSAAQAERGIFGEEASVAQRSLLLSLLAPKSSAAAALMQSGIDIHNFQHFGAEGGPSPEGLASLAKYKGYSLENTQGIFDNARQQAEETGADFFQVLTEGIADGLKRGGKSGSPVRPDLAAKFANDYINSLTQGTDVAGLIMAMRDAAVPLTAGLLKQVFEPRQIPRLLPLITKPEAGKADVFGMELMRQLGEDYAAKLATLSKDSAIWDTIGEEAKRNLATTDFSALDRQAEWFQHLNDAQRKVIDAYKGQRPDVSPSGDVIGIYGDAAAAGLPGAFAKQAAAQQEMLKKLTDSGVFQVYVDGLTLFAKATGDLATWLGPRLQKMGADVSRFLTQYQPTFDKLGTDLAKGVASIGKALDGFIGMNGQNFGTTAKIVAEGLGSLGKAYGQFMQNHGGDIVGIIQHALSAIEAGVKLTASIVEIADKLGLLKAGLFVIDSFVDVFQQIVSVISAGAEKLSKFLDNPAAALPNRLTGLEQPGWMHTAGTDAAPLISYLSPSPDFQGYADAQWRAASGSDAQTARATQPPPQAAASSLLDSLQRNAAAGKDVFAAPSQPVQVTGSLSGDAELHLNQQIEVKPTTYFEGIVARAENVSRISVAAKLGTTMTGSNGAVPAYNGVR